VKTCIVPCILYYYYYIVGGNGVAGKFSFTSSPWRPMTISSWWWLRVESKMNIYIYLCTETRREKIKTVVDDFGQVISRVFLQSRRAPVYFIVLQRHIYYASPAFLSVIGRKTFWIKQQRSAPIRDPSHCRGVGSSCCPHLPPPSSPP